MKESTKQKYAAYREYVAQGHTREQAAEHFGVHVATVRKAFRDENAPKKTKDFYETRNKEICDMRSRGAEFSKIAEVFNITEAAAISVCQKYKIDMQLREKRNQEIVALRKQGYSQTQLKEMFGLTDIGSICKRYGVGGVMSDRKASAHNNGGKNQYAKKTDDEKKRYVESFLPVGFSYAGGYVDCEHDVTIRCEVCGTEFNRSMNTLRNKKTRNVYCDKCEENKREERKKAEREQARQRQTDRQARKAKRQADIEAERFANTRLAECEVCGKAFKTMRKNQVCCSPECTKRRQNRRHDKRIDRSKKIDKNISVNRLYELDKGTCWICGGQCDQNDYYIKDNVFIAGDYYPSIDHIIPVCMGGVDAWNNVRLAHRICNTKRYQTEKLRPPCETVTA